MRTVVFDLDGTLADTAADLIASANSCLSALGHGHQLDPARDGATAFKGGRAMLQLGFERAGVVWVDEDIDGQYPKLLEAYGNAISVHTKLYPYAKEAVEELRAAGYATAICTNKPEALAEILLTELGVRHLFDSLVGADTLPTRKPDAAPYVESVRRAGGTVSKSILIGDTATDRNTGIAAEIPVVLVTFGPGGSEVEAMEPEALLHDYRDLTAIVRQQIG
ncbi:HAD hydrolase-like protein [Falsirhodobacter sp. alg1]|uniref:HAD hydrolase-like protein n=1 Tax=Falsirhodobacter sp. alg1 TaxID=1472418 RepID=UPI0005F07868|nr:HAD hydrolase-like protein [Falsirhodobacter sp. alg1]